MNYAVLNGDERGRERQRYGPLFGLRCRSLISETEDSEAPGLPGATKDRDQRKSVKDVFEAQIKALL